MTTPSPDTIEREREGWLEIAADYERRLTAAEAEIERLRATLIEIQYCEPVKAASIASRALEGK